MKKILFALPLLLFFCMSGIANAAFTDVTQNKEEVQFLVDKEVIQEQGEFRPNDSITRVEAVTMLMRSLDMDYDTLNNPNFTDISEDDTGYEYIAKANELGFISGKIDQNGNSYFDPNGILTRAQMAKIIVNAFSLTKQSEKTFSDVPSSSAQASYITNLASNNITTGYSDGTFKPNNKLTRIHFAVFLARTLEPNYRVETYLPQMFMSSTTADGGIKIAGLSQGGNLISWHSERNADNDRYLKSYKQLTKNAKELDSGYVLKEDGTVWELNETYDKMSQINGLKNLKIETIESFGSFIAALTTSNELYILDPDNTLKQGTSVSSPLKKLSVSNIKQIEVGANVLFVLQEDGTALALGKLNKWANQETQFTQIPIGQPIKQIVVSDLSNMYAFLTEDNQVYVSNNTVYINGDFLESKVNISYRLVNVSNVKHIYSTGPSILFVTKEDKYFKISSGAALTEHGVTAFKMNVPNSAIAIGNASSQWNGGFVYWLLSDGRIYAELPSNDPDYDIKYFIPALKNALK
ncbi:S-layer homology domain-containing protein [Lysinibacillus sp. NPDC097287]|uniref:S-layer homology domain-containing protein n=1 Tax=Lysinibacillus sp. NPDC097287 TaxID=3364144 RepID=UPI0037FD8CE3